MRWHHLSVASLVLASSVLPFSAADQAVAQTRAPLAARCVSVLTASGNRILVSEDNADLCVLTSASESVVFYPETDPYNHDFELFNNSYRDILYLHLFPVNDPSEQTVYGGTRKLAPGRAWSVNLTEGCSYNVLVEYEDGAQDFYESVNTCDYRGIQLR